MEEHRNKKEIQRKKKNLCGEKQNDEKREENKNE